MKRLSFLLLVSALAAPFALGTEGRTVSCGPGFAALADTRAPTEIAEDLAPAVRISPAEFKQITDGLAETISGNLATVLRSEWKMKDTAQAANAYIRRLTEEFLSPETRALVTRGLDPEKEGYIRSLGKRLYDLGEQDKKLKAAGRPTVLKSTDLLGVRDPAPAAGAKDFTFTYYTRPVTDGDGKHQVRVRNYVRTVDINSMRAGEPVNAFGRDGGLLKLQKGERPGTIEVTAGQGAEQTTRTLSAAEVKQEYGNPPTFYAAPHGGKFKLEVKTRLKISVANKKYATLAGRNLVQKLDVSLSPKQVSTLFAPLPEGRPASLLEARERLARLKEDVIGGVATKEKKSRALPDGPEKSKALAEAAASRKRIDAVFKVLNVAVENEPAYLKIQGATFYSRSAFEIAVPDKVAGQSVKLQTTVDRDLGAFENVYAADGSLLDPIATKTERALVKPASAREQRHVELKAPLPLVDKVAGLENIQGTLTEIATDSEPTSSVLERATEIFSLTNVTNRGKFNHYMKRADVNDRKELR